MGKLNLFHIKESDAPNNNINNNKSINSCFNKKSRSINNNTEPGRFKSLVDENPFKVKHKRRKHNEDTSQTFNLSKNTERFRHHQDNQFTQKESAFPELSSVIHEDNKSEAQTSCWKKAGVDIVASTSKKNEKIIVDSKCIKPGWLSISENGFKYGPKSENYERVLESARRTQFLIHIDLLTRNKRINSDNTYTNDIRSDGDDDIRSEDETEVEDISDIENVRTSDNISGTYDDYSDDEE